LHYNFPSFYYQLSFSLRKYTTMLWTYTMLFIWSFLSASLMPISSDPYFMGMVVQKDVMWCLWVATIGNILGGMTSYYIGKKAGVLLEKNASEQAAKRYKSARKLIHRYGSLAMSLSWVPFLGDIIVAMGGAVGLPFVGAMGWMAVGKFVRYVFLAQLALGIFTK
jgi:membrane protein YqaA with SNARE-associated domain